MQFMKLGMLSPEGKCRSFDVDGKGYVRSETIGAIFLQKKSSCRRWYSKIINSKVNTDGAKEQGITYPSGEMQARLLREIYAEANIDPALVTYIEAHGTGTKAGDPQELNAIADVFTRVPPCISHRCTCQNAHLNSSQFSLPRAKQISVRFDRWSYVCSQQAHQVH
jgi:fatty acid synthase